MAAKTPAQRQQEKRDRDKKSKEEREALLLSRRIVTDLYQATDMALIRIMTLAEIEEPQDIITRLIHAADSMSRDELRAHVKVA